MEQSLGPLQKAVDFIKRSAEKVFWPNFGRHGLPEVIQMRLETLPEPIQLEYYEDYDAEVTRLRNGRNFTLVAFLLLIITSTGGFWAPMGLFMYWLHLKYRKIPDISNRVMQGLQVRYNLQPTRQGATAGTRSYQSTTDPHRSTPRNIVENYDPSNLSIENLKEGYMVDYNLKTWQVTTRRQFDWASGISAREFKLVSDMESIWVYLFKEGNHTTITVSKPLNIYAIDAELETEILHTKRPYNIIHYQSSQFFRENALEGYLFNLTTRSLGIKVNAWEYYDQDRLNYMRIEQQDQRNFRAVVGKLASEFEFTDILPQKK